ncbi:MAG: peptide-methionine (R)-S-oxide reductase MsrB [Acidobacteriota bacterium]|nr:peptide-methionine (R)-S-oxide reductase MsrB [Acidobacteriota bacterium]MDE3030428.1 peptide-methionine (R)-S-oxide reductase MsrB [Acidobacteriota bacterium]MDE3093511.1 peptide-methionine (R)-S-oxide reductase MsrB [Acidobacteriota bacterium]MDE3147251.1 peptide-methionine (R)-S-oxide reductase MsrB [Acidobacteriota bacterium]
MDFDVNKTDEQWRAQLAPERYEVLRRAATEAPFSGSLLHVDDDGVFTCAGCGQRLFTSDQKFDSGCGWPSFDACEPGSILEREDNSLWQRRIEILCSRCGGHLGHVFPDGPTPTGLRYCVNSLAIDFSEARPPLD